MKVFLDATNIFHKNIMGIGVCEINFLKNISKYELEIKIGVRFSSWGNFNIGLKRLRETGINFEVRKIYSVQARNFYYGILQEKFDIFHGFENKIPKFFLFKPKCVLTLHDIPPQFTLSTVKKMCDYVDIIITHTNYMKREIVEKVKVTEGKILVVYEGVSDEFKILPNKDELRGQFVRKYDIGKRKIILVILSHDTIRGMNEIEETVKILGGRYFFVSCGIRELKVNGVINFGYVSQEELIKFYNIADVLFFPQSFGGFGLPVLEAMKCGCPVLTSKGMPAEEIGGDAFLTADRKNPKEMAEKLVEILENENFREKMRILGLKRVETFSWEKYTEEIYKIYKSLL